MPTLSLVPQASLKCCCRLRRPANRNSPPSLFPSKILEFSLLNQRSLWMTIPVNVVTRMKFSWTHCALQLKQQLYTCATSGFCVSYFATGCPPRRKYKCNPSFFPQWFIPFFYQVHWQGRRWYFKWSEVSIVTQKAFYSLSGSRWSQLLLILTVISVPRKAQHPLRWSILPAVDVLFRSVSVGKSVSSQMQF